MHKKLRWIFSCLIICGIILTSTLALAKKGLVEIRNKGNYYQVTIDACAGTDQYQLGYEYGQQLRETVPNFEMLADSYIAEITQNQEIYNVMLARAQDIWPQVPRDYQDEIEGMAKGMELNNVDIPGDDQLSTDEFIFYNLFPDTARDTQCCFISVFGSRSATHKTLSARILDFYTGSQNQLPKLQAVTTIKYQNHSICLIGYLGYVGVISGFNDSKVFAAILDSPTGAPYSSQGKRSYPMDLRQALETNTTLAGVADWMIDPNKNYAYNHLIALSDPHESKILENNFSGTGTDMHRALRSFNSKLNPGITWGFSDAVASVNSFLLLGNDDNHTNDPTNTARWASITELLNQQQGPIFPEQLKKIISFHNGTSPGLQSEGDLYNVTTQQIILFEPDSLNLEIFFRPQNTFTLPDEPVFEKVVGF